MSDGERTALVIAAEVVAAAPGSIFIIDEPELHIHRAIVVSLFTAVVVERADCAFVISTHELELANSLEGVRVLLVRESEWHGGAVQHWDIDLLPTVADVPESLRVDLLGARRKILFVEGTPSSLDQPFYSLLFPDVSVCAKETCRDVRRSVVGLQATFDLHHVAAFGIVDGDGMPDSMVATLRGEGVFALPVYSVEGLYYSAEVRRAIAELQSKTFGVAAVDLIAEANAAALESLKAGQIRHLAVLKSERIIREKLIAAMPERDQIAGGKSASLSLSVSSPFEAERTRLEGMVANADLDSIVASYPIRESGVLTAIAAGLRFRRREDYERAALTCIGNNSNLQNVLRAKFATLEAALT